MIVWSLWCPLYWSCVHCSYLCLSVFHHYHTTLFTLGYCLLPLLCFISMLHDCIKNSVCLWWFLCLTWPFCFSLLPTKQVFKILKILTVRQMKYKYFQTFCLVYLSLCLFIPLGMVAFGNETSRNLLRLPYSEYFYYLEDSIMILLLPLFKMSS